MVKQSIYGAVGKCRENQARRRVTQQWPRRRFGVAAGVEGRKCIDSSVNCM